MEIAPLTWEGKRSAAAAPDAEVVDKPTRRRFSPSYKLRVVEEADRCTEPGEVGRLLRREGLYSSHLTTWRKAVRSGSLRVLSKRRGRKPSERNPLEGKVRKLERENTRLEKELEKARLIIDVQGKVAGLLGLSLEDGRTREGGRGAGHVRRGKARVRCAQGRPSHVLSSSEAIDRASAAPPDPSPGLEREGTRQGLRHAVFGAIVDRSPAEVVATLLDEDVYLCSERTMYRVLASQVPVRERRAQRSHPEYQKPELMATGPGQVWSWDITRLLGPRKWSYFYLYVIMDIFSRYIVGWMVADRESSALAGRLIQQSCLKHGVQPQVLTLHSDRGAPMTSQCTAQLLADLGVTPLAEPTSGVG